jgi:hypothetical protein
LSYIGVGRRRSKPSKCGECSCGLWLLLSRRLLSEWIGLLLLLLLLWLPENAK